MAYIISRPWGGSCGIGHQFFNWATAWQLAHYYDLQFVHAPFCGDQIEYQIDTPVRVWEDFLNFGQDEIQESQLSEKVRRIQLPLLPWEKDLWLQNTCNNSIWKQIIDRYRDDNVLFECAKNQFIRPDRLSIQHTVLRRRYWRARQNWPIPCDFDSTKLNVAIHIRRGDVTPNGSAKDRWVNIKVYSNLMNQISNIYGDRVVFHIYSDDAHQDFHQFGDIALNVTLHIRENVFHTFHHMVMADMLIVGKSSFSALAGHISCKIKIAQLLDSIADRPLSLRRSVGLFTWESFPANEFFITMQNNGQLDINVLQKLWDTIAIREKRSIC